MTPKGKERLLKLAEILDVADARHRKNVEPHYNQGCLAHACGTPACALGHWAAANPKRLRRGLGFVSLRKFENSETVDATGFAVISRDEFGITEAQSNELFEGTGCGNAQTAKQAAAYIRKFVARADREQNDAIEAYRKRIEGGARIESDEVIEWAA